MVLFMHEVIPFQHDLSDAVLNTALDSVVEECVSFVGVDLNVGSEMLLRYLSHSMSKVTGERFQCRDLIDHFLICVFYRYFILLFL